MTETLFFWTALPNPHPALVHFPIAFVVLAVLFELGGTAFGRPVWIDKATVVTWLAAGLGAWAAWWAGEEAAESMAVPPHIQGHLNTHSDWGHYTLYAVGAVAVLRFAAALWRPAPRGGRAIPALFLVLGLVAAGIVARTADLGGGLVYGHGLAVGARGSDEGGTSDKGASDKGDEAGPSLKATGQAEAANGEEAAPPVVAWNPDGSLTWTPRDVGAEALGSVLTSRTGEAPVGLTAAAEDSGLRLSADGTGFALLEEPCGDAQIEADLTVEGFQGTLGLAHHVREDGSGGLFLVDLPSGAVRLVTRDGSSQTTLDEGSVSIGADPVTLAVSGAGRHFRGLVDGELVAHGHQSALPDGRCGLYYDGSGTVRLTELRVLPVE